MILTTTEHIPGKDYEILGLVRGSTIQSKNLGKDITQGLKSLVGGPVPPSGWWPMQKARGPTLWSVCGMSPPRWLRGPPRSWPMARR